MEEGKRRALFVGIDWATEAHDACVVDADGNIISERKIRHSGPEINGFVDWLLGLCENDMSLLRIGIEVPRGALVEMLIERGLAVYSINPKQMDRFRDRYFPAGAKDDRRDAFVLATSLRTDERCFRIVKRDDPEIIRLRDLSRFDDELRLGFNRYCCQLREQLQRYYPQLLELCPAADERWMWALLELAPTPSKAARLTAGRVQKLLTAHRIRRFDTDEVLRNLRAPGFSVVPGTIDAASEHALLLLPHLRLLHAQRLEVGNKLEQILKEEGTAGKDEEQTKIQHRDIELILSLPGVGRVVAATMLAEASEALRERDYHALRSYAGIAPITRRSGKSCSVSMRRGCNQRLRNAMYHWSRVSVQCDAVSRDHYQRLRGLGHNHGRALRGVTDRLLAVMIAMLRSRQPYDATLRHRNGYTSDTFAEDRATQGCDPSAAKAAGTAGGNFIRPLQSARPKALNPRVAGAKPLTDKCQLPC